jgi:hypothetical protein
MIPFGALGGAAVASRYGLVAALWAAGAVALLPPFLMAASPVGRLRAVSDVA